MDAPFKIFRLSRKSHEPPKCGSKITESVKKEVKYTYILKKHTKEIIKKAVKKKISTFARHACRQGGFLRNNKILHFKHIIPNCYRIFFRKIGKSGVQYSNTFKVISVQSWRGPLTPDTAPLNRANYSNNKPSICYKESSKGVLLNASSLPIICS